MTWQEEYPWLKIRSKEVKQSFLLLDHRDDLFQLFLRYLLFPDKKANNFFVGIGEIIFHDMSKMIPVIGFNADRWLIPVAVGHPFAFHKPFPLQVLYRRGNSGIGWRLLHSVHEIADEAASCMPYSLHCFFFCGG